jgi:hypothetical protein
VAQDLLQRVIRTPQAQHQGGPRWNAALPPNLARRRARGELPFTLFLVRLFIRSASEPRDSSRTPEGTRTYPEAEGFALVFAEMYPNLNNRSIANSSRARA